MSLSLFNFTTGTFLRSYPVGNSHLRTALPSWIGIIHTTIPVSKGCSGKHFFFKCIGKHLRKKHLIWSMFLMNRFWHIEWKPLDEQGHLHSDPTPQPERKQSSWKLTNWCMPLVALRAIFAGCPGEWIFYSMNLLEIIRPCQASIAIETKEAAVWRQFWVDMCLRTISSCGCYQFCYLRSVKRDPRISFRNCWNKTR